MLSFVQITTPGHKLNRSIVLIKNHKIDYFLSKCEKEKKETKNCTLIVVYILNFITCLQSYDVYIMCM